MSTLWAVITTERDEYIVGGHHDGMSTLWAVITTERDEYIVGGHHGGA